MNRRFKLLLLIPSLLLILPLIAMQFTNEVKWTFMDFIIGGILLFGVSLLLEFVRRKIKSSKYRIALSVFIVLIFTLTWVELAVGIFGTPFAGN